jgi:hypothetical protein
MAASTRTVGTGPDSLVLKLSQDAYQGDAQYTVLVDGKQVGPTFTASALHGSGQSDTLTLKGDWAAGAHKVEVKFLNDAWGGTAATDRNLHVDAATYNGKAVAGAAQVVGDNWTPGAFSFTDAAAAAGTPVSLSAGAGADSLVLKISQSAWQGPAQYTVAVDGKQVGGTFTASASHAAKQSDTLTLKGDWAAGPHQVSVKFLNDLNGSATGGGDRNLFVDGAAFNGQAVAGAKFTLASTGAKQFGFTDPGSPVAKTGGDGADLFEATAAGGTFTGKGGNDLFRFGAGDGDVTVTDFARGADKLVFAGFERADITTAPGHPGRQGRPAPHLRRRRRHRLPPGRRRARQLRLPLRLSERARAAFRPAVSPGQDLRAGGGLPLPFGSPRAALGPADSAAAVNRAFTGARIGWRAGPG